MCGGQDHGGGEPVLVGAEPVGRGHAPSVTRDEPRKVVLRHCRGQVVPDAALVIEKLLSDHCADGMTADVSIIGVTRAVAEEPGDRISPAWFEVAAEDIAIGHAPSIAGEAGLVFR